MKTATAMTLAQRFGYDIGRMWRRFVSLEERMLDRTNGVGFPRVLGRVLFLCIAIFTLSCLLFVAFWFILLLVVSFVVTWLLLTNHLYDEKSPELRDGHSGIGWYNKDDLRVDMDDQDEP